MCRHLPSAAIKAFPIISVHIQGREASQVARATRTACTPHANARPHRGPCFLCVFVLGKASVEGGRTLYRYAAVLHQVSPRYRGALRGKTKGDDAAFFPPTNEIPDTRQNDTTTLFLILCRLIPSTRAHVVAAPRRHSPISKGRRRC